MVNFFEKFYNSKYYKIVFYCLIGLEILFFPFMPINKTYFVYPLNPIYYYIPMGPFIYGIYIQLFLMMAAFFLYKNIYLYLLSILAFSLNFALTYIGKGVSSRNEREFIMFMMPIILLFIVNIILCFITFKYKHKLNWSKL